MTMFSVGWAGASYCQRPCRFSFRPVWPCIPSTLQSVTAEGRGLAFRHSTGSGPMVEPVLRSRDIGKKGRNITFADYSHFCTEIPQISPQWRLHAAFVCSHCTKLHRNHAAFVCHYIQHAGDAEPKETWRHTSYDLCLYSYGCC